MATTASGSGGQGSWGAALSLSLSGFKAPPGSRSGGRGGINLKMPSPSIKKEDLTINTGLNLLTANTGSDQSTVDDGLSPTEHDKQGKSELAAMQAELAWMNEENQRLRGMLNQVTTNYHSLHMHLVALTQQRNQKNGSSPGHEAADEKTDGKIVPRQFLDLGPAANADEPSQSSTEGGSRDRSSSPRHNVAAGSMDYGVHKNNTNKEIVPFDNHERSNREDSPDPSSEGWNPNKAPSQLPPPKSAEQAQEATMRKARVSVRARSEAPMKKKGGRQQNKKEGQRMPAESLPTVAQIKTVVVLVQENRSFDHMLGWMKSLNPAIDGVIGRESNPLSTTDPNSV